MPTKRINPFAESWIVAFWARVFELLARVSVFVAVKSVVGAVVTLITGKKPTFSYAFVDWYVSLHTLASFAALVITTLRVEKDVNLLLLIVALYATFRIFEVFVYQVNVLLFDQYRAEKQNKSYVIRGYRRMVLLLIHNYFELVCWFGVLYIYLIRSSDIVVAAVATDLTIVRVFRESLLMMVSFQPEKNDAGSTLGVYLLTTHSVVGLVMTIMVFARFLALLPPPKSLEDKE